MRIIGIIMIATAIACSDLKPEMNVTSYYNLDSLVTAQVNALSQQQVELTKTVAIDQEKEEKSLVMDSVEWQKEFEFFRQLNINEPRLVGGYNVEKSASRIYYTPKEDVSTRVKNLEILFSGENVSQVSGLVEEENDIYKTRKKIMVKFKDNLVSSYSLDGYQKIILKDSADFSIKGKIE